MAEDRIGGCLAFDRNDVAEFHIRALARRAAGRQRGREQARIEREPAHRECHVDGDRFEAAAALRIADLRSSDQRADRVVDSLLVDAVKFERLLIDGEAQPLGRHAETVVDIDDEIDRLESFAHASRDPRRVAASGP